MVSREADFSIAGVLCNSLEDAQVPCTFPLLPQPSSKDRKNRPVTGEALETVSLWGLRAQGWTELTA